MATTNSNASRPKRSAAAKRGQATRRRTTAASTSARTTSKRTTSQRTTSRRPTTNTAAARAQRSAAGKRGEATRRRQTARRRTTAAQRTVRAAASQRIAAETKQAESVLTQVTGVAESALLVPVGAALEVRDRVVNAIQPWTSRPSAEKELTRVRRDVRRFERRGSVARNRVLRELRKRRNTANRELRKRRNDRGPLPAAAAQQHAAHDQDQRQARPGPDGPVPHGAGEGREAAGRPRPEGAADADEAGKGPRAAVRLSLSAACSRPKFLSAT